MMDAPLLVSSLLVHAEQYHGDTEIVSRTVEGGIHRYTYAEAAARARKLANALTQDDIARGDRVASLAWNGYRHFELYYGVSGMGAVMHTINPRLFPEQIVWIINNAQDQIVCFDLTFAPLIAVIASQCPTVRMWVAMTDRAHMPELKVPNLICYEEWIGAQSDRFDWPALDEKSACTLCYTSGTTGNPKGVLYSHRSLMLHTFATCLPDVFNIGARDCVLPVVPMFHVNAWGVPYGAAMVGAKLVLPGAGMDGASLYELFESEKVTVSAGVPTIWQGLQQYLQTNNLKPSTLKRCIIGGSAVPPAMMQTFENEFGIKIHHAWGMTEMSPLGTFNTLKNKHLTLPEDQRFAVQTKQGRPPFGVQLKIVDEQGAELPRDGKAFGDLHVKGYWIVDQYYGVDKNPLVDGWFPTGDVGTLDPDGFLQITDRSKDVIKSGGEWIGSIDLENVACAHPAVAQAAAIGAFHPKWDERPLLVVVKKPGQEVSKDELLAMYPGKVAKWWIPDDVTFVEELPLTATGKISKLKLREQLKDYKLPTA
ncbi:long-chain-fatty-acid--CoA ligase [Sinimarinibacterium sp. NLF-5-8]|nr:long-chain-fatty-acid--CoA ligase [Sinimarinibacterium sp. NLF-5-8]